ncbi:hypothetical protein CCMSSC00406_0009345 [Pleurotus cornucopiae]|uniref:Uncharacterized protein n=1 Tax=Pleurotus cornucopiae TaxID=5321 RepID=A0ACB7ITK8_PLECO|nr:hypothetical protein CCMSSC00406_0009345 [Pleurotus cornucopiae]
MRHTPSSASTSHPSMYPSSESHRKKDTKPTFGDLVVFARPELALWGCALRRLVSSDNVSINFFCEDAANFFTGLPGDVALDAELYPPNAKERRSKLLSAIDTSNLVDPHWIAECDVRREDHPMAFLSQHEVGGDATTILGVVPLGTVSGLTTYSNRNDTPMPPPKDAGQVHERTVWRRTEMSSGPLSYILDISVSHFALLLFQVYQIMFAEENYAPCFADGSSSLVPF